MRLGTTNKKLNAKALTEGVTKECPMRPGFFVTVLPAATYNRAFKRCLSRRPSGDSESVEEDFIDRCAHPETLVDGLITKAGPIYDDDGEEMEYTREIGLEIFANPENADVVDWVVSQSISYGQWYAEEVDADSGNSKSGSSGNSAGAKRSRKTKS